MLTRCSRKSGVLVTAALVLAMASTLGGCMHRKLKPLNPCLISGVVAEVAVQGIDKVDLLFVVDSSQSMVDEQVKLKEQIPALVQILASGMRADGTTFPAAKDMHLGVVTTDMGAPGANLPATYNCSKSGGYGEDGLLQTKPGAHADYTDPATMALVPWDPDPTCTGFTSGALNFITFTASAGDDPTTKAHDLGCLAQVGPGGCGFEMQLEAPLKALWPSLDIDPNTMSQWVDPATGQPGNRITFLTTAADVGTAKQYGYGDTSNSGFLRNNKAEGISLIAVLLVTDEDDCSSMTVAHLIDAKDPAVAPEVNATGTAIPVNLRCVEPTLQKYLWPTNRYVQGLQALRPGNENLVIFGAISGVPQYLVTPNALSAVNFEDESSRNSFYNGIRGDVNMTRTVTPTGDNIKYSCTPSSGSGGAYPPLRILDVVQGFGENGVIQSICEDSFEGAINLIIDVIAKQLGAVCLPRELVRDADGMVGCDVVWELPALNEGFDGAPMSCGDPRISGFVKQPEDPTERMSGQHARCIVKQLPVINMAAPTGDGWFYDDFTQEVLQQCRGEQKQRVAFGNTQPPNGVVVQLECLNQVQSLPQTRTDINYGLYGKDGPPTIGTKCEPDPTGAVSQDQMCEVKLNSGVDKSLFCHKQLNVCVQRCNSDAECPKSWVCDKRPETTDPTIGAGQPICVNPTCGGE